jgi:transcriptional regulator with XRE-family HTH domain
MDALSLKVNDLMNLNNINSLTELAKYIKVAHADLRQLLSSKTKNPDKKILKKLAAFFEISMEELIQDNRVESLYISEADRHHGAPSAVLRYLMQDVGNMSEGELFRRTGVPQPTIHRILSGATPNPRMESIEPLAEFFNVTSDQMLGRVALPPNRISGTFMALSETKVMVPLLDWSEVANWPGILKAKPFKLDREWVTSDSGIKGDAYALKIPDTNYLPEFRLGTLIIIDSTRSPKSGDFAVGVFKKDNTALLGRLLTKNNLVLFVPLIGSDKELLVGLRIDLRGVISEAKHHF